MAVIHTDTVLINGQRYSVADGFITKRRIFPEQEAQAVFDTRGDEGPTYGDLNPAIQTFVIDGFHNGSGLYIDHGKRFSGRAWFSTLEHTQPGLLALGPRRQAMTVIPRVYNYIHYRNRLYALTNAGLYENDPAVNNTFTIVSTNAPNGTAPIYHAVIHGEYLWLARTSDILRWDGLGTAAGNFATSGQDANLVASFGYRLYAVEAVGTNGLSRVRYSDDNAVTWKPAIVNPAGVEGGIPTPLDPRNVCIAPDGDGTPRLHVSTASGVWIIDESVGVASLLHDMSHNTYTGNGYVLAFWPSTRKLYVNERSTLIEINPETGEAIAVGPDLQAGAPPALPTGLPTGFKANYLSSFSFNPDFFYIGTSPASAADFALVMKMSPDHKWYFETRVYNAGQLIRAMNGGASNPNINLYFAEDEPATTNALTRFLESNGDYGEEGEVHSPWLTFGFPDLRKCLFEFTLDGDGLSPTETIQVIYRKDYNEATDYTTPIITSATAKPFRIVLGTYPTAVGDMAYSVKFIIKLDRNDATTAVTPRWFRLVVKFRLMAPPIYSYDMNLLIDRADNPNRAYADLMATLETAMEDNCSVPFIENGDPNGTAVPVVPLIDARIDKFEQTRNANKVRLTLVEVAQAGSLEASICHTETVDSFAGTGAQTVFNLLFVPLTTPIVFVDDTYQVAGASYDYTISGQTITFVTAPGATATIRVHYSYQD